SKHLPAPPPPTPRTSPTSPPSRQSAEHHPPPRGRGHSTLGGHAAHCGTLGRGDAFRPSPSDGSEAARRGAEGGGEAGRRRAEGGREAVCCSVVRGGGVVTAPVVIDARAAARPELGGVERWARELSVRLPALAPGRYAVARPPGVLAHRAGHAWEQIA